MTQEQWTSFGIGVIAGAVVGGAVALLFAPKSGKETRTFIKDKFDSARHAVAENISGEKCTPSTGSD